MKSFPYEDIVHLPHHVSKTRPQMPVTDRAAQFAPFAALAGHDEAVAETARLTDSEHELSDTGMDELNLKLQILCDNISMQPEVTFTYFVPDEKKSGGAYVTRTGRVRRIDEYEQLFILTDKSRIPMAHVLDMESPLFETEMPE